MEIYCVDIGSELCNSFAWAKSKSVHGKTLEGLKDQIKIDLAENKQIALGFECPLYFDLKINSGDVTKCRERDDRDRASTVGAGAQVSVTGFVQITWLFRQLALEVESKPKCGLLTDWAALSADDQRIFIWEANISNRLKPTYKDYANRHIEDCLVGLELFEKALIKKELKINRDLEYISLIGSILLRTGWTDELSYLHEPCLVIK